MKKLIVVVYFLLFPACIFAEQNSYRMATLPYSGAEPFVVALELNLFEANGIHIDEVAVSSMADWFEALNSSRIHFNLIWALTGIGRYLSAGECVMTGMVFHDLDATKLVVRKGDDGKGVVKPGMKISINSDLLSYRYMVSSVLEGYGLNLSQVRLITELDEHDSVANFNVGRLHGILVHQAYIPQVVTQGNGVVLDYPDTYINATLGGAMTPIELYRKIPEKDFVAFWKAVLSASYWMSRPENKQRFMEIIREKFASNTTLINAIRDEAGFDSFIIQQQVFLHNKKELSYYNGKGLETIYRKGLQLAKASGQDTSAIRYDRIFKTDPVLKAYEALHHEGIVP